MPANAPHSLSSATIQSVALADISPRRALAYRDPLAQFSGGEALIASIKRRGILQPVLLCGTSGELQVIAGFRRLEVAHRLGLDQVPARVEQGAPAELFLAAVEEHTGVELNLREQARAMGIAQELGWSLERIVRQLCAPLGINPHSVLVEKYLRVMTIPPVLFELFVAKGFSLRQCLPYCELPPDDGDRLAQVAVHLGLGSRQLETATTWLLAISRRDEQGLAQVVDELDLLLPWEPGQQGQAQRRALGRLEERRFPETCARRREVEQLCGELGDQLLVRYDRNFSRDTMEVVLQAGTLAALDQHAAGLQETRTRELLAKILERLSC